MKLYLLRHGLADRSAWSGDDVRRPLTEAGRARMAKQARTLQRLGLNFDAIVTSPLTRARQTAEIVAAGMHLQDRLASDERLGPGFGIRVLPDVLQDHASAGALLLVGHEPSFSETIAAVIGGGDITCKKGSLARIDLTSLDPPAGELVWLIPAKALTR